MLIIKIIKLLQITYYLQAIHMEMSHILHIINVTLKAYTACYYNEYTLFKRDLNHVISNMLHIRANNIVVSRVLLTISIKCFVHVSVAWYLLWTYIYHFVTTRSARALFSCQLNHLL